MSEQVLITTEVLAARLRRHPESIRRLCRSKSIPFAMVDSQYRFDYVEVFEHFVKADIAASLELILEDGRMPDEIRNNIRGLANGLRDGSISMAQFASAYDHVRS